MIVPPISGAVRDERTLLPIESAEVLIEIRTPLFSLHGQRSELFFTLQAITGKDGRYRTPWTFQRFVDFRTTFQRVYKVTPKKKGYTMGGGWSMEHYTGITPRASPFENWMVHSPKRASEIQYENARTAIYEALNVPPVAFPVDRANRSDAYRAEKAQRYEERLKKQYMDEILRYLLFVGFMMEHYGGAGAQDQQRLLGHCRNISEWFERSDPEVRQGILQFLDGRFEGRDVASVATRLAEPAHACLRDVD